ncbi:hypothetical protein J2S16_004506 [Cytobacillus kochii]|nr:hypothetical protein [Cytobacillus kochii]MDQ0187859.1 hypothetical protein [Cytobacillus kochii]
MKSPLSPIDSCRQLMVEPSSHLDISPLTLSLYVTVLLLFKNDAFYEDL